jgi:hypothetical protein
MERLVVATITIARKVEIPDGMPAEMAIGKFGALELLGRDGQHVQTLGDLDELADSVKYDVRDQTDLT